MQIKSKEYYFACGTVSGKFNSTYNTNTLNNLYLKYKEKNDLNGIPTTFVVYNPELGGVRDKIVGETNIIHHLGE